MKAFILDVLFSLSELSFQYCSRIRVTVSKHNWFKCYSSVKTMSSINEEGSSVRHQLIFVLISPLISASIPTAMYCFEYLPIFLNASFCFALVAVSPLSFIGMMAETFSVDSTISDNIPKTSYYCQCKWKESCVVRQKCFAYAMLIMMLIAYAVWFCELD